MNPLNNFNTTITHRLSLKTIFTIVAFVCFSQIGLGQTTTTYDFSSGGAVTGLNETSPGISIDTNIGFGSFKNSGSSNPAIYSGQLRLYQNATRGGSIKVYANNGVTITNVVIRASNNYGPAGYDADGVFQSNLSAGTTYTMSGLSATTSVEFFQRDGSSSNRIYVDEIEITYTSGGTATPGISLGTVSGNTNESGTTATFTAVLDAAPTSDVFINVTSGDTGEVTVSPSTLTFTSVNWDQTQTITATGIDDALNDGNVDVTITVGVSVSDINGNSYDILTYGTQQWTLSNAEVVNYSDGTIIPQVTDGADWGNLTTGAWCYYNNDSSRGKLYNWYAIMGIHDASSLNDPSQRKNLAPEGWHVPSDGEWTSLENYLIANGYNYDGSLSGNKIGKAMASSTGWANSIGNGNIGYNQSTNNSSGFNVLPEPSRYANGNFWPNDNNGTFIWSTTENPASDQVFNRNLAYLRSECRTEDDNKTWGASVRFINDTSTDSNYDGISTTTTVTNEDDDFPNIVITEFMYNTPGTDDEWIEVYNGNGADVDISNWTLTYSGGTFTFPGSTTLTDGDYITIALGSDGDGTYNNDNPFTPDFNDLTGSPSNTDVKDTYDSNNLGNTSGTITLKNGSGTSVDIVDYDDGDESSTDGSGPSYEILDVTGNNSSTASNWQASASNGGSPGKLNSTIWTGATDTNWDTSSNWTNGQATTTKDILIPNGLSTYPIATGNVTINSGASLTIAEEASLQVSGDFTNDGTVTLNSTENNFSSLIVTGTAIGDIVYNRYVNSYDTNPGGGGWDLVGAPVGMTISDFATANAANLKVLGDDYAFSQFDNVNGQWVRYQTASQTGSFIAAQGYSMATNTGDGTALAFTGAMQTTSQSINIINNNANGGGGRRWNLVSNPFPSYINGNTAAGATNFIGANTAVIDGDFGAVYGWNGSSYDIYNLLDDAFSIAPGQAFWIAAASTTATALNFTAGMRTTTGTGDFVTGPMPLTHYVALELYNGETQKATTDFYFRDGLSLGIDPWYDAGAFNQSTKLSSRLAEGSQETAFARNAMGMDAMQNT